MVLYQCSECGKTFNKKSNYDYHVNKRKVPCTITNSKTAHYSQNNGSLSASHYTCPQCGKTYASKYNLNRHIHTYCKVKNTMRKNEQKMATTKIPKCSHNLNDDCYNVNGSNSNGNNKGSQKRSMPKNGSEIEIHHSENTQKVYACEYCGQEFSRNNNWNRHVKNTCKVRKQDIKDEEKEKVFQLLLKKIQDLEQQMAINNTTNNNNSHNNTNNSHNNTSNNVQITNNDIKLIAFGHEDLYAISDEIVLKKLLCRGLNSVTETIRYTHLNKQLEKYHNIYVSNKRDSRVMVFNGNKWVLHNKKEAIDLLYEDKHMFLKEKYQDIGSQLKIKDREKFDRFLGFEKDKDTINTIKIEIQEML